MWRTDQRLVSPGPEWWLAAGGGVVSGEAPKGAPGASWAKVEVLIFPSQE